MKPIRLIALLALLGCSHDAKRENPLDPELTPPVRLVVTVGDSTGVASLTWSAYTSQPSEFVTAVVESHDTTTPSTFTLSQNYPNPFNPETTIRFDLPQSHEIELAIYNLAAQRVATLVQGYREAGSYSVRWDGVTDAGLELASGVYFYRLTAGERVETRKLFLLR